MSKNEMLYEGKAKKIFATNNTDEVIIEYKDDATAGNGAKKGIIGNKGILNNAITTIIFEMLMNNGVPTHFIKKIDDRNQLCKKVTIIPLEVIVRNVAAGSMAKRLGIEEGTPLKTPVLEISYKNDALGDPLINDYHAVAIGITTFDELNKIYSYTKKINELLVNFFLKQNIRLIDFKIEFGKYKNGNILLADEISPDTCRLWDATTNEKLDKDRFRRDLGKIEEAYQEIFKRLSK